MARDTDKRATSFETENAGGLLSGFLAEEDVFDRRVALAARSLGRGFGRRGHLAVSPTNRRAPRGGISSRSAQQEEQIRLVAKESQSEARRLASAIETLNGDRDRLFSRVTVLEQGLDTVTGAITKQQVAASPSPPTPSPAQPPASTAAAPANDPQPPAQKQPRRRARPPLPPCPRWRRRRRSPRKNPWISPPRWPPPPGNPFLRRWPRSPRKRQIHRQARPRRQPRQQPRQQRRQRPRRLPRPPQPPSPPLLPWWPRNR